MGKCIIFCAGEFDALIAPIGPEDYILAADGGLRHTQALGIPAQEILGDFDSLGFTPEGARVFPVEKDDTDSMLAVRRGLQLGYREFLLYGSLDGPRLDHTVANFQTLQFLADRGAFGFLVGRASVAAVLKNGSMTFPAGNRGSISVFSLSDRSEGVTEQGLYYSIADAVLTNGFPLGASNHFTGQESSVQVRKGSLLLLWDRACGLPREVAYADL